MQSRELILYDNDTSARRKGKNWDDGGTTSPDKQRNSRLEKNPSKNGKNMRDSNEALIVRE